MKRPLEIAAALTLVLLASTPAAGASIGWPKCSRDYCPGSYLSVITWRGNATLSVGSVCPREWRHIWGRSDASGSILQWFNENAEYGEGRLCIPLHPDVDDIRIKSTGGDCGYGGNDVAAAANSPMQGVRLRRGGEAATVLRGCHATIGNERVGRVAYGGIALNFADGYTFGDSYVRDHFYGVYDGLDTKRVKPADVGITAISQFNTYHYRIEILANGRGDWTWGKPEENER
ncbi:hypothetical protein [uncultured Roseobacter sp.]|uniref:hypothetical protein n=1 Tax=uncultured Roseobacter sp. TaxID=114847 RepID=UPI002617A3FF|nr:hypothetical protein [uncultured Roseobacter sp.]